MDRIRIDGGPFSSMELDRFCKFVTTLGDYRNVCKIEHFLCECVRTEKEQNRLEKK